MLSAIGFQEIIFVAIVVLILFGPRGVSETMRELGRFFGILKKHRDDFSRELMTISENEDIENKFDFEPKKNEEKNTDERIP